jgi:PAS domain S-box-containing protein
VCFTPARIAVLKLLASQAAISLENTRLYSDLKEREAKIRRLVDANIIGIVIWNVKGRIIEANEAFLRMVEYGREDLVSGRVSWRELTPGKWREADEQALAQLAATGICAPFEKEYFRKDGSRVPALVGAALLEGRPDEGVAFVLDLTERKRAELLLAGEKRLLEMIARGDSRALILDALCRLVEELASGSLSSILLLDPKANRLRHGAAPSLPVAYTAAIDGAVIGPSVGSCGTAAYRAEPVIVSDIASDPLWTNFRDLALAHGLRACWSTPIISSAGRVLGTFAIYYHQPRSPTPQEHNLIDQITHLASIAVEREQAEAALRQAQANLAHMTRLTTMGELTASIAHEVNQPLTAVVNNANACLDLLDPASKRTGQGGPSGAPNLEEVREALAEIIDDADRASAVIMRIRQLAKRAPVEKSLLDLKDVVNEVLALARYESVTRSVTIRTDLPRELPLVSGDRVQLQQVLLNLVMNGMDAMKAIEESKRILIISGSREMRDGVAEARLCVQDGGTGLNPQEIDRLFEAFYTTKPQGMGMGLAISRSIIEAHGGRLWAEPNQGPGATFSFTLPDAGRTSPR